MSSHISGRASIDGTKSFITTAGLSLHHRFDVSGLFINPIIHGAPRMPKGYGPSSLEDDQFLNYAISRNKSNCVYIYNNYAGSNEAEDKTHWFSSRLDKIVKKREEIVTIAGLGKCAKAETLVRRLEQALKVCNVECIDAAVIEVWWYTTFVRYLCNRYYH
jgi:hypothetical protein